MKIKVNVSSFIFTRRKPITALHLRCEKYLMDVKDTRKLSYLVIYSYLFIHLIAFTKVTMLNMRLDEGAGHITERGSKLSVL